MPQTLSSPKTLLKPRSFSAFPEQFPDSLISLIFPDAPGMILCVMHDKVGPHRGVTLMNLKRDLATKTEYPETDGKPMAETDTHARLMIDLRFALDQFFRDDPDVYVSGNLLIYYEQGNPKKRVAPDVFVVRGVHKGNRRIYKLWEEGRAPDVVFEISSRQTWREDMYDKWRVYEQLGIKEYFIFDPEYDYLMEPLLGWCLEEGQYAPLELSQGRLHSEALGLELVDTGATLRLWDPRSSKFLSTPDEESDAHRADAEALLRAESEVNRLRQENEQLRRGLG
jgi:Uma2 family endonuclease